MNAPFRASDMTSAAISLPIEGMTCASCVGRVEGALKAVEGVTDASANLATERATIRGNADVASLIKAIANAGYESKPVDGNVGASRRTEADERAERKETEQRDLKRDFTFAALLTAPVCILEMGPHLIPRA
ncbi:cation transport ATPase [Aminobacter lissarensis]|uniref:Cation transport ATPase n=1 Tax=Aminobacter carboxidus TaxID=376165 RepID=A0A8E1WIE8_9HYPH|nr:cation transport ATPase [Aminobacter lissarensis]